MLSSILNLEKPIAEPTLHLPIADSQNPISGAMKPWTYSNNAICPIQREPKRHF